MKSIISIIMAVASFVCGHLMQADLLIHPQDYNLTVLDTSEVPDPVEKWEKDDFMQLSEVNMHYRIYGKGKKPLILIHGNGGSVESLSEAASYLANHYTVYVTESRCHGQSSDPGVISYDLMAKDIREFASKMNIRKPVIMGHSDGAIIALDIAALYPDFPGAIISCGANSDPSAFWPYFTAGVRISNFFRKDKLNDMMLNEPHFTEEFLGKIKCPSYIVCGEFDIMKLSDTLFIHESVKGSDLAVLRGENHSSYMSQNGKKAYVLARNWLDSTGAV